MYIILYWVVSYILFAQAFKLFTNIDYESYKWFLNWDLVNDDFIDLKVWNNNLKLILYDKDDYKIKESSVIFYVE